jgi:cell division protein FtsL
MSISARIVVLLLPLVVLSAITVVYVKYVSRQKFSDLQQAVRTQDALEVEWSRMQLEQNTWSTSGRIENLARQKLGLQAPSAEQVFYIKVK